MMFLNKCDSWSGIQFCCILSVSVINWRFKNPKIFLTQRQSKRAIKRWRALVGNYENKFQFVRQLMHIHNKHGGSVGITALIHHTGDLIQGWRRQQGVRAHASSALCLICAFTLENSTDFGLLHIIYDNKTKYEFSFHIQPPRDRRCIISSACVEDMENIFWCASQPSGAIRPESYRSQFFSAGDWHNIGRYVSNTFRGSCLVYVSCAMILGW